MTHVQADWLTLLLVPVFVIALATALVATRSASRRKEPAPGWAKGLRGVAVVIALCVALINMAWGKG